MLVFILVRMIRNAQRVMQGNFHHSLGLPHHKAVNLAQQAHTLTMLAAHVLNVLLGRFLPQSLHNIITHACTAGLELIQLQVELLILFHVSNAALGLSLQGLGQKTYRLAFYAYPVPSLRRLDCPKDAKIVLLEDIRLLLV